MIDETIEEIREMQTHSSSVVAVKATRALAELTERDYATVEDSSDRSTGTAAPPATNPSHASLHTTQHRIVNTVSDAEPDDVAAAKELTNEAIDDVTTRWSRQAAPLPAPCRRSPTTTCC